MKLLAGMTIAALAACNPAAIAAAHRQELDRSIAAQKAQANATQTAALERQLEDARAATRTNPGAQSALAFATVAEMTYLASLTKDIPFRTVEVVAEARTFVIASGYGSAVRGQAARGRGRVSPACV